MQKNKIIIGLSNHDNLWYEFIIPVNEKSTVTNFLKKNGPSMHHLAYYVDNFKKIIKEHNYKNDYTFIKNAELPKEKQDLNETIAFFFNNNIFIEFLTNEKSSKKFIN